MSVLPATPPDCDAETGSIGLRIESKQRDLGGFEVRRVLPAAQRRMVGPVIFFDEMGPADFAPGQGIQVRPHPHIGLATITYLFEGEIMHRDSLGVVQPIRPGAVNLMTAGRGIVHSERAGEDLHTTARLHGIQLWIALPAAQEEAEPTFVHHAAGDLPEFQRDGVTLRVIIGEAWGQRSPVEVASRTLYLECRMPAGTSLMLPDSEQELAAYVVSGEVRIDAHNSYPPGVMAVAAPGQAPRLEAVQNSHVMVIGGDPLGERHIWWNFVSSRKQRIEQASRDWKEQRFAPVPGETEFIPLPE